jgi:hypothetical protein
MESNNDRIIVLVSNDDGSPAISIDCDRSDSTFTKIGQRQSGYLSNGEASCPDILFNH